MSARGVGSRGQVLALAVALAGGAACLEGDFAAAPARVTAKSAAVTVSSGFIDELYAQGLSDPTAMTFAPDGRLFVCEQGGRLRVIRNGALLATPFLTVPVSSSGERGLLGVALDPAFASNGFLYVYYTATSPVVHNRVSRFTATGDVAVPGSELPLVDLEALGPTNHNGGAIHFGPDGKLYVAVGENATGANAQTLSNRLGKLLRVNADGSIPEDNPFFTAATGANRAIWALGLRNPFTFTFERGSGRMFINDVGEVTWEEIDQGAAGANYGWPVTEGPSDDPRFRPPIHAYTHDSACAITGGAFYDPPSPAFPASFLGRYFFADLCGGWIRVLDPSQASGAADFATGISQPVDLAVGLDGALYYLARGTGTVGRIRSSVTQASFTSAGIGQGSDLCLDGSPVAPATPFVQAACSGAPAQSFDFRPVPGKSNVYFLRSRGGALCANVSGGASADGTPLILWACGSIASEQLAVPAVAGFGPTRGYWLRAVATGKCAGVAGVSSAPGAAVEMRACVSGDASLIWRLPGRP